MDIHFIFSKDYKFISFLLCVILCLLLISCNETPKQNKQRLIKNAKEYFESNNYEKALNIWKDLAETEKKSTVVYEKIGDCYYKLAHYNNALKAYRKAFNMQPSRWKIKFKIAKLQLIQMNFNAAEESVREIKTKLNYPAGIIFQGDLFLLKKNYLAAANEYKRALMKDALNETAIIRLALCYVVLEKNEKAEQTFNILRKNNVKKPDTLLQMANYYSLRNNYLLSQLLIKKAITASPKDNNLQIRLAELYNETGQYSQAIFVLENLRKRLPKNEFIKKILVESMLLGHQLFRAKEILENLTESEDKNLEFSFLKGKYFLINLEYNKACSQFQCILEKEPNLFLAYYFMGIACFAEGLNNLGRQNLVRCLSLNPDFSDAELALADFYYKNGEYDLAMEYAQRIKKKEPENFRPYLIIGNIHLAQKNYHKATVDYQSVHLLYPKQSSAAYYTAMLNSLLGNYDETINLCYKLLKKNHKLVDVALLYTYTLHNAGRDNEAIEFLFNSINHEQSNPYLYLILGNIYLSKGEKGKAKDAFSHAIIENQHIKYPYQQLWNMREGHDHKIEKLLIRASTQTKDFHEAFSYLAKFYLENGEPEKATYILEKAVKTIPNSPELANNLAWIYLDYKPENIDKALRLAQKAYDQLPNNAAVEDTLGWAYYKKNLLSRANWMIKQAIRQEPNNQIITGHLKMIQKSLKKTEGQSPLPRIEILKE